ncbi:MAG: gliding motility-associated C-terminal domain-containing protein [Taibaiella sp.]|nr:gliding motility-associated C-terminal domain-containing protein [Taibaiella sp.]
MYRLLTVWLITLLVLSIPAKASHIVGGEVTYKCLGGNSYAITVSIYEDCLTGLPEAIAQDDPAFLNIFDDIDSSIFRDPVGNAVYDSIYLPVEGRLLVPANFSNLCIDNPPSTCLRRARFTKIYTLPNNFSTFTVVYQRCCRNASVLNIFSPATVGATYYCIIPAAKNAACNNSAVFKNYPPQIICINNPLFYDHSAIDPDGDSLSYEFCTAYVGGSESLAKPIPKPPPFDIVSYVPPFTSKNPMGGFPKIQIDPISGLITGTPNVIGRFVVTVCCHEWRNGKIINTVRREFQFVVTNCSKAVVADIPILSSEFNTYIVNCEDYTVHFINNSKGGFSYNWDFGDTKHPGDTSNLFQPTYIYTDTGTFVLKLVVNRGSTCPDSITRFVKVYPKFKTAFDYSGLQCPGMTLNFVDLSSSTYKPINFWYWNFGDSTISNIENPTHSFSNGGTYNVLFVARNFKGCTDTVIKKIVVEKFKPFAGNDTIIVKGESIYFDARGGTQYTWTPGTNLNATTISNPTGYYPDTGRFSYTVHVVSPYGCVGSDTINVSVVNQAAIFVPSGFSPNGDGRNDVLRPVLIGYKSIKAFNVYNRWGQMVYHTNEIGEGWDGTFYGKKEEIGTYYWMLQLTDRLGKDAFLKGDVTLLR